MMLDDNLFGMLGLAYALGISFRELLAMPHTEALMWQTFFERKKAEGSLHK